MSHEVWSVRLCLCVGHTGELCNKRWTDRDAVWRADSCGLKEPCIRCGWGSDDKSAMRPFDYIGRVYISLLYSSRCSCFVHDRLRANRHMIIYTVDRSSSVDHQASA